MWSFRGGGAWDADASVHAHPPQPRQAHAFAEIGDADLDARVPLETRLQRAGELLRSHHDGTFRAACIVVNDCAVPPDRAFPILRAWADAQGWESPIDDDELHARIANAQGHASGERGSALASALMRSEVAVLHQPATMVEGCTVLKLGNGDDLQACVAELAQRSDVTAFVIAGMGAGKTEACLPLVAAAKSVQAVAPTRGLVRDLQCRAPSLTHYQDAANDPRKLVTTIHSATKYVREVDLAVVDELPYVFSQIFGKVLDKLGTLHRLIELLARPPAALALGADISPELLELLTSEIRRVNPTRQIVVVYKAGQRLARDVVVETSDALRHEFLQAAAGHKPGDLPLVYASTGKRELEIMECLARREGLRTQVVHGETDKALLDDMNTVLQRCDLVLLNHAVGAGMNITAKVGRVFLQHATRDVGPNAAAQLIGRFRNIACDTVLVGMPRWKTGNRPIDPAAILATERERAAEAKACTLALRPAATALHKRLDDPVFSRAWSWQRRWTALAFNHPDLDLAAEHHEWSYVDRRSVRVGPPRVSTKEARALITETHVVAVLEAKDISEAEHRTYDPTPAQRHAASKQRIRASFGRIDADIVRKDHDGRYSDRIRRLLCARDPDLAARVDEHEPAQTDHDTGGHAARGLLLADLYRVTYGRRVGSDGEARASELRAAVLRWVAQYGEPWKRHHPESTLPTDRTAVKWLHDQIRQAGATASSSGKNSDRLYRVIWPPSRDIRPYRAQLEAELARADQRECLPRLRPPARIIEHGPHAPMSRGPRPRLTLAQATRAVAEQGGQRAAARALGVGPATLHRALRRRAKGTG